MVDSTQTPSKTPAYSGTGGPNGPAGEPVLRAIAMPADTNPNGDIFGGWLISEMDLGGAVAARDVDRKSDG
jgi:acyl-CoA hydrolase